MLATCAQAACISLQKLLRGFQSSNARPQQCIDLPWTTWWSAKIRSNTLIRFMNNVSTWTKCTLETVRLEEKGYSRKHSMYWWKNLCGACTMLQAHNICAAMHGIWRDACQQALCIDSAPSTPKLVCLTATHPHVCKYPKQALGQS